MHQTDHGIPRLGMPRTLIRLVSAQLVLFGFCGCADPLSPERQLLATQVEIAGSARYKLTIESPEDLPVRIEVQGHEIDVRAAIVTAKTTSVAFADAPNRRMGVETLHIDAPHTPSINIVIERNDHSSARGRVSVQVIALPIVTEADRRRAQASALDAAGCLEFPAIDKGREAVDAFQSAARLHMRNADLRRMGLANLHAAGSNYVRLDNWAGAADLAAQAAKALEAADALEYAAIALRVEGAALDQFANASGVKPRARARNVILARTRLTEAADRFRALGNHYEAGYALNYRGVSFDVAGDRERARGDFEAALGLFRQAGDGPAQALSLQSLALQSFEEGRIGDALVQFDAALALIPRDEDRENYAHTLHNSALPLRVIGRFSDAMSRFHEAGTLLHELGDRDGEARALHGLGTTLMYAGDSERASEFLEAAIRLRDASGSRREQAISMLVLGQLEREAGRIDLSTAHLEQALSLVTAPHDLAQARLSLARTYFAGNRPGDARRQLVEIMRLPLPATHRYRGLALVELGDLESHAGRIESSRAYFARAIEVLQSNGSDLEYARTLVRRASAHLRVADYDAALADADNATRQLDTIGLQSLQAESRAAFRASYRDAIETQISVFLSRADSLQGRGRTDLARQALRSALAASDRARSRLLLEAPPGSDSPASEDLRRRRDRAYDELAGKRAQRERLQNAAKPGEASIARLTRDIAMLRTEAVLLEGELAAAQDSTDRRPAPDFGADPAARLPEDFVVAEYFMGRAHCWLFEVRHGEVEVHVIGNGAQLARIARDLHMAWRNPHRASGGNRLAVSRTLTDTLFGRLEKLSAGETLYIIADGPLHLIPMAVLAEQAFPQATPGSIQVTVSLAALEQSGSSRASPDRTLAVIADPIYAPDDLRIAKTATGTRPASDTMSSRGTETKSRLNRLPSAEAEARTIVSLAGRDHVLVLSGADANRHRLETANLGQYRILHFATHSVADSQDPALSSLSLSRFDQLGRPLAGDLRALDIARLRLNADLVVLSACDTAVGREIAGEAPLGMSHAFLRGGARSVVATLWQVPDTSTAHLMKEFYRQMLVNGRAAPIALALAQRRIRGQPRWSDPYYWAGYQLTSNGQGEISDNTVARREE